MPVLNKLEYLNETKQQIKNALNTNFDTQIGDNDTFRSYVDKIKNIYENWSKVTGIGTDLTLNNTKNGKMGVIPEGNASQGILPSNYMQVEYIESTGTQYIDTEVIPYKTTTELKCAYTDLSKEQTIAGCFNNESNRYYVCQIDGSNKLSFRNNGNTTIYSTNPDTDIHTIIYNDKNNHVFLDNQEIGTVSNLASSLVNSLTLFARKSTNIESYSKSRIYYCKIYENNILIRNFIPCYRNSDNEIGLYDLVNNIFYTNQGTGTFLYGNVIPNPNPTPDTPIPIKVVTGEQNVEISGKNLIPTQVNAWEQGSISVDGNVSSLTRIRTKNYYPIKNDVTYHVSVENEDYCFLNIWLYDKDNNYIVQYYNINKNINGATNLNIIIPSTTIPNLSYMRVVLRKQNNTSQINPNEIEIIKPQIELGTIRTSFEPYYTPQTYPLSLGNIELAKIGDYKDYIFKNVVGSPYYNADLDLNGWYKYKAINKYTFTGNETISVTGDVFYTNNIADNILTSGIICICNRMKAVANTAQGSSVPLNSCCFRPGDYSRFYFNMSSITTVASEIKQYLSENNTYVIYPLATPTYEKITDTTLITQLENLNNARSYKGTTIIECTSESDDNEVIVANVSALMKGVQ